MTWVCARKKTVTKSDFTCSILGESRRCRQIDGQGDFKIYENCSNTRKIPYCSNTDVWEFFFDDQINIILFYLLLWRHVLHQPSNTRQYNFIYLKSSLVSNRPSARELKIVRVQVNRNTNSQHLPAGASHVNFSC